MVYYIYREGSGQWRWRLVDGKGMAVVNSEERYAERTQCAAAVELLRASSVAPVCLLPVHETDRPSEGVPEAYEERAPAAVSRTAAPLLH